MQIRVIHTSQMLTNTYVVLNGDKAFVVDAGGEAEEIARVLSEEGAELEAILLTHAHFDHIGAVKRLVEIEAQKSGREASVFLHKADVDKISSYKNMGFAVGAKVQPFTPDVLLVGGETINVAGINIKVIHTPGHTKGGVCYVAKDVIFSGDTLFAGSYGRTDFYDGSFKEIKNSIVNKLFRLEGEYRVLPGHGDETTLMREKKLNAILSASDEEFGLID